MQMAAGERRAVGPHIRRADYAEARPRRRLRAQPHRLCRIERVVIIDRESLITDFSEIRRRSRIASAARVAAASRDAAQGNRTVGVGRHLNQTGRTIEVARGPNQRLQGDCAAARWTVGTSAPWRVAAGSREDEAGALVVAPVMPLAAPPALSAAVATATRHAATAARRRTNKADSPVQW